MIVFTAHVRIERTFCFSRKREETYVTRGFTNWKDACESFKEV